jgi:hypothetical protein
MAIAELFDYETHTDWQDSRRARAARSSSSRRRPNVPRPELAARPRPRSSATSARCRSLPLLRPQQPRVRLLGRRVRGGPPPRRLHRVGTDRGARPPAAARPADRRLRPAHGERRRHRGLSHPMSRVACGVAQLRRRRPRDLRAVVARHRVLQIGVVVVDADGTVVDRWSSLVKLRWPFQRVGPTKIHGITRRTLRGAPALDDTLDELGRRLDGSIFTAHNAAFDAGFLDRAVRRRAADDPLRRALETRLCTLRMSRRLDPDTRAVAPARRRLRTLRRVARAPARRARRRRGHRRRPPPPAPGPRHHRRRELEPFYVRSPRPDRRRSSR